MANFNVPPYYDDYDENKGYYKILFRPSVAVQARELNQMQTMLQKQVERFGAHIFREGSIVLGGAFDLELDVSYVKAISIKPSAGRINGLVGKIVIGQTSGVQAVVRAARYDAVNDVYAILLRYTAASTISDVFINDEVVQTSDDASLGFTVVSSAEPDYVGSGSIFSVSQGVVFSKGYFLAFPAQTVIIEDYSATPTKTIGLQVTESFVTELTDETLADNALGTTNENAPGAHRYKVDCTLTVIDYKTGFEDENFIPFINLLDGVTESTNERSQYARLYDELAKRTFDESGDYYVRGFDSRTREHLDTGSNEGLLLSSEGGDSQKLSVDISPGTAYVKGYEVNKLITQHIITDKSTAFNNVNNQLVNARTGGYFFIQEIVGSVDHDEGFIVNLYDTAETRITSRLTNLDSPTGKVVGTARMKAMIYESGTLGRPDARMRAYLYDFIMNPGFILSDAKAIGSTSASNKFFADIVLSDTDDDGNVDTAVLNENNSNILLFPIGASNIKTVRSNTGSVDTNYQFIRTEDKTADLTTAASITASVLTTDESLSYTEGSLSSAEKREIVVSLNSNTLIQLAGTVSNTSAYDVLGISTEFTKLSIGDRLQINGNTYYINAITNSTSLQLKTAISPAFSGNVFFKSMLAGDIIDLTANGSTGITRTANVSAGVLTIDLKERTTNVVPSTVSAKLSYRVERNTAAEVKKILRSNRFVQIQTNTNIANTTGTYNLGLPDVYKIRSIRMDDTAFSNTTGTVNSSNVTTSFTLDNGQRDNYYDHSRIIYNGSANLTNKSLLVELDHFVPDYSGGFGYFSVDSYPVDDNNVSSTTIFTYEIPNYVSTSGTEYSLRDVLDFRPVKQATALSTSDVTAASVNPSTTTSFVVDTDGLRMAAPDSDINADYSFYLARRDIVTIDKNGEFGVIQGEPGITPISPNVPENVMGIANIYIPPYPSISETLARILNKPKIACSVRKIANIRYTMREIGVLKNRIENLEYYNALTLLEKSAVDLKVTDAAGLDRFKNGFFVDGFLDHSLGDTANPDYKVAVDKIEQVIRPFFQMDSFQYKIEPVGSSNYQQTGSLITLPYTQVTLLENKNVTTIRNIEQSVFRFIGTLEFTPDGDVWCDSSTVDKTFEYGNEIPISNSMTTQWGSWETHSVGYNVYDRNYGDRSGTVDPNKYLGSYTSYAAAVAASKNTPYYNSSGRKQSGKDDRSLIQTVTTEQRTGIATTVTAETKTQEIGNFVTDVSIQPYIRPQTILIYGKGLKANTKYYCFFDGENMSAYISPSQVPIGGGGPNNVFTADPTRTTSSTPLQPSLKIKSRNNVQIKPITITSNTSTGVTVTSTITPVAPSAEGSVWRSDEYGELFGYLRLPDNGKRFRTGTKEVIITDSPTNAIDATSYAKGYWVSSGLSVQKQNTILSTKIPVTKTEVVTETRTKQKVEVMGPSCMAYSFKVDVPREEDGIFLTSVDVWVESKHPTLGVWFEIREMDSAGGITRNQVPNSEVWLKTSQVNTWNGTASTEESGKTRVSFPAPVFLLNDTQYAFVIHTEGLNPDYYFWVSRLGETDILTKKPVTARQLTGTLFTTNNNLNYDMVPDVDMKVRFNRAQFSTGSATIIMGNKPVEFLNIANNAGDFVSKGETIETSEYLSFSSTSSGANTIAVTDIIRGVTSNAAANVISINGSRYLTDYYGFVQNETFNVFNSSNTSKSITGTITLVDNGIGTLRSYSSQNNVMIIDESNGKFYANAVIFGLTSGNTAKISSFDKFKYSTTTLKPYYLVFNKTTCAFDKAGWLSNSALNTFDTYFGSSIWYPGTADSYSSFNNEVAVLSRNEELTVFGNSSPNSSARVRARLTTTSQYVSPVIDVSRFQSVFVHNIINNDDTGEANTSGGNLLNRYISKPVTLADGQDAEDLLVKLTAYKPPQSDVKVWMKVRNGEDGSLFNENYWVEMSYANNFFSSEANKDDFVELEYNVPDNYKNSDGILQYIKNATNIYANTANAAGTFGVNAAANSILIVNANTIFSANDEVYYSVPPNGTPIAPLTANTYYFIDTANSSAITLKSTAGGSQIDITEFRTDANAEVHTIGGDVFTGFKQYSVKVGLKGTNSAKPPRVGDLRVIALQM